MLTVKKQTNEDLALSVAVWHRYGSYTCFRGSQGWMTAFHFRETSTIYVPIPCILFPCLVDCNNHLLIVFYFLNYTATHTHKSLYWTGFKYWLFTQNINCSDYNCLPHSWGTSLRQRIPNSWSEWLQWCCYRNPQWHSWRRWTCSAPINKGKWNTLSYRQLWICCWGSGVQDPFNTILYFL